MRDRSDRERCANPEIRIALSDAPPSCVANCTHPSAVPRVPSAATAATPRRASAVPVMMSMTALTAFWPYVSDPGPYRTSTRSAPRTLTSRRSISSSSPGGLTRIPFTSSTIALLPEKPRTPTAVPTSEK